MRLLLLLLKIVSVAVPIRNISVNDVMGCRRAENTYATERKSASLLSASMCTNGVISSAKPNPLRITSVVGFEDRRNDVVYSRPSVSSKEAKVVVFFPGDVQDYIENMEAHRDNKQHKQWNLENTALIVQRKFPENHILVVKPSRMDFKTFSCFQNFVNSNQLGAPDHTPNYNSLIHLNNLIRNVSGKLMEPGESSSGSSDSVNACYRLENLQLVIVGFSKGCVVLNQFLYEFHHFKTSAEDQEIANNIVDRVTDLYWLDGGHSGGKNTWVNDKDVLKTLCSLNITVHVHVSPYQIQDDRRPWIKKEEKAFSDYLQKHGCKINRTVHFESVPPSILMHFDVINAFKMNIN